VICLLNNKAKGTRDVCPRVKDNYNIALCSNKFFPTFLALELPEWFLCRDSFVKEAQTECSPQRYENDNCLNFSRAPIFPLNGWLTRKVNVFF